MSTTALSEPKTPFWGDEGGGGGSNSTLVCNLKEHFATFLLFLPSSLEASTSLRQGNERKGKEKGGEKQIRMSKALTCIHISLCRGPTCMVHTESYCQNPSETIPSLSLKDFKGKTKTKAKI